MVQQHHQVADTGQGLRPAEADFEKLRLAMFARHGFQGESRWIQHRAGRRTYMIARGDGARPTVLVHGGYSQAAEWALLARHLRGHVVIPDRPGHGLSYAVDHRNIDFKRSAADWLLDLVDGIEAEAVDLVGNSIGGAFAILFAAAHPTRVRRLALIGAPAGLDPRGAPLPLRMMGMPGVGRVLTKAKPKDVESLRRLFGRLIVTEPDRVPTDLLEVMLAASSLPGSSESAYSLFRAITTLRGIRRSVMINDEAARVEAPTLFVWGENDVFTPPAIGETAVATMANAQMSRLPNAGHVPHIDHPQRVAFALDEFLS